MSPARFLSVVFVLALVLTTVEAVPSAEAQAPTASVPGLLRGTWDGSFGDLGPVTVELSQDSATIVSQHKDQLGFLAGKLSATDQARLKVLWRISAFQQGAEAPLPASAWPQAVADNRDPAYPDVAATTVTLRYDSTKDQLSGTYTYLDIQYDDKGKYLSTKKDNVDIQLSRRSPCNCADLRSCYVSLPAAGSSLSDPANAPALCNCLYKGSGDQSLETDEGPSGGVNP